MKPYLSFNEHHSPWGAYSSFVLGENGAGGGFVLNDVQNPGQNIYAGYRTRSEGLRMFPFCHVATNNFEEAFGLEKQVDDFWIKNVRFFTPEEMTRDLGFATDTFRTARCSLTLYTPFGPVPELSKCTPETVKRHCVPGILAELTLDNRESDEEAVLFFGMSEVYRLIGDFSSTLAGGASVGRYGFAVEKGTVVEDIGFNPLRYIDKELNEKYRLGREALIKMSVAPGEQKTLTIALATYQHGIATSGLPCRFFYTDYFQNLEEVLDYLLSNKAYYLELARRRDEELRRSGLNAARQRLLAHAVHSYHASSELLTREDNGKPVWVVNEGEYRMMNTLDLTVDQLFFELKYHPWTVKNILEFACEKYAYTDKIRDTQGGVHEGGVSFTHDCGVGNMFSAFGTSAYEFEFVGSFSYMTMEELLNWTLCASVYAVTARDDGWKPVLYPKLLECYQSIVNRDKNRDGVMDCDCVRCVNAYEITTYDSLDPSLSQARNNVYMAVKTFGAYLSMARAFRFYGDEEQARLCESRAAAAAKTVADHFMEDEGYIPSIFEGNDVSMVIPAIEGLVYPLYLGDTDLVSVNGPYGELIDRLGKHLETIMQEGRCLVPGTRGWKLSSNNANSWMSKIFLCQFVAEKVFGYNSGEQSDETHLRWQWQGCPSLCAVDQVNCIRESDIGSRLYPRLVTAILWME